MNQTMMNKLTRRGFGLGLAGLMRTIAVGLALAPCLSHGQDNLPAKQRPNIIVILADDLGYADIGVHGCRDIPTPHIDSLAKNGVRCTDGYVSAPYCSPSRAGLLTGRYQQRFGHEFNPHVTPVFIERGGKKENLGLPTTETTIADQLKAAGYFTGLIGKWHLGELEPKFYPQRRGFDEFFGFLGGWRMYLGGTLLRDDKATSEQRYVTDAFGEEAVAFVQRRHDKGEPFFLYLAFNAPHLPLQATEKYLMRFPEITDPNRRTYAAMVSAIDDAIGLLLTTLKQTGQFDNTLIVFFSDNGGATDKMAINYSSNQPLRGSKGDLWEGGIRVPFLMQWPNRLPKGTTYSKPVIQLDILPTALAAAGLDDPPAGKLDGVNLLPFLTGQKSGLPHDALYWRFGDHWAVRRGDWKMVRTFGCKKPRLSNLAKDLSESRDWSEQAPEEVGELTRLWTEWNRQLIAPLWPPPEGEMKYQK